MLTITSGKYKNLTLYLPPENITRPISQKVRAAVFNSLAHKVVDSCTLDLYAGSGAMSIEAISRGARVATLVDNNFKSISAIKKNIQKLNAKENISVINMDINKYLSNCRDKFDVIIIDPPYSELDIDVVNQASNLLQYGGVIVVSRSVKTELNGLSKNLQLYSTKVYGDSQIDFIKNLS